MVENKMNSIYFGRKAYHLATVKWAFPIGNRMESERGQTVLAVFFFFFFFSPFFRRSYLMNRNDPRIRNLESECEFIHFI